MTVLWEQEFLWTPTAKERPRAQPGGKGRSFTPKRTRDAEAAFLAQYRGPSHEGPLRVEFGFWNDRVLLQVFQAEDYTNRKVRGDVDNYLKLCTDALNKWAWDDDRQIVDVRGYKN